MWQFVCDHPAFHHLFKLFSIISSMFSSPADFSLSLHCTMQAATTKCTMQVAQDQVRLLASNKAGWNTHSHKHSLSANDSFSNTKNSTSKVLSYIDVDFLWQCRRKERCLRPNLLLVVGICHTERLDLHPLLHLGLGCTLRYVWIGWAMHIVGCIVYTTSCILHPQALEAKKGSCLANHDRQFWWPALFSNLAGVVLVKCGGG